MSSRPISKARRFSLTTVNYFNKVQATVGDSQDFYRLFMVPGMGHCMGGPGTDQFDKMAAITDWVEHQKAPDQIVASHKSDGNIRMQKAAIERITLRRMNGSGQVLPTGPQRWPRSNVELNARLR